MTEQNQTANQEVTSDELVTETIQPEQTTNEDKFFGVKTTIGIFEKLFLIFTDNSKGSISPILNIDITKSICSSLKILKAFSAVDA